MDKLSKQQQESVKKMSTERLRLNLLRVGQDEETVLAMDREALLNAWAAHVLASTDKPQAAAAAAAGYDVELERQKLVFEKLRYEEGKKAREEELALKRLELQQQAERDKQQAERDKVEAEKVKIDAERAKMETEKTKLEAERAKLDAEKAEREAVLKQKELEQQAERDKKDAENKAAELRERELAQQAARDQEEKERKENEVKRLAAKEAAERVKAETPVARLKLYGDALKNSISTQPLDPFENIAFFRNVENLFDALKVPDDLRGILLRPHLNAKSATLVSRMEADDAASYTKVKDLLLKEYKMSPATYRDSFNTLTKHEGETFAMFASRL
jgi:hypothetical protein